MKYTEETLKIANFMGITPIKEINEHTKNVFYYYNNSEMKDYEALPFYNTWEELMPVVIKIESVGNEFVIFDNCVQLDDKEFIEKTKIEAVLKAVIWWISQHN
jgi:hypothetical protein